MFIPAIIAGFAIIIFGIVFIVFRKQITSSMMKSHRERGGKPGNFLADRTKPNAAIYPGVAFAIFGVVLVIYGFTATP